MQLGEQYSTAKGRFARDNSQVIFMHYLEGDENYIAAFMCFMQFKLNGVF